MCADRSMHEPHQLQSQDVLPFEGGYLVHLCFDKEEQKFEDSEYFLFGNLLYALRIESIEEQVPLATYHLDVLVGFHCQHIQPQ